ncbi:MAG TPA: ATP-binding protein [Actinomycetota bacterium]|nr:ATP-binding protein [Actinomycetota bacterium]
MSDGVWLIVAVVTFAAGAAIGVALQRSRAGGPGARVEARPSEEAAEPSGAEDEQRRRMDLVLSSMLEGVILFGPDGHTVFANPAAERHLGAVPRSLTAVLPLTILETARRAAGLRQEGTADAEVGSPSRWLRASAVPVGGDGSVLLVVRDVTEAKRVDAIRRDFVANASHELKTPAASIQAAAETIRTASLDDPDVIPRFAAQLEGEAVRLSRIVGDLLDLSRLESGSELDEAVAVDAVLRDEVERFDDAAAEAGVRLSTRADAVPRVRGSARDLALLVRNLVDNAVRYTRAGGRVDVELSASGSEVVLSVRDTGVGIPQRDLPRIFERFYRVDRARSRETGGTGLGLSIVRHIVENHGGRISVASELGRGTSFEVRLPALTSAPRSASG